MKTIWKHKLEILDQQIIRVPKDSIMLSVGEQFNDVFIWFECNDYLLTTEKIIYMCGTGHEIPNKVGIRFIGTVIRDGGNFVWHVFE